MKRSELRSVMTIAIAVKLCGPHWDASIWFSLCLIRTKVCRNYCIDIIEAPWISLGHQGRQFGAVKHSIESTKRQQHNKEMTAKQQQKITTMMIFNHSLHSPTSPVHNNFNNNSSNAPSRISSQGDATPFETKHWHHGKIPMWKPWQNFGGLINWKCIDNWFIGWIISLEVASLLV